MPEIRQDPFTGEYVIVNDQRMARPITTGEAAKREPKECPFCPNSQKRHPGLPRHYRALAITNLFSALQSPAEEVISHPSSLYTNRPAEGICEVILYSSDHELKFYNQPFDLSREIVDLWVYRYQSLGDHPDVRYVFIFENRGEAVGVTIHHPHGQVYALPVIPPRVVDTLERCSRYLREKGSCMLCDVTAVELRDQARVVAENELFVAFVPYFAKMLYEVQVVPKRHVQSIADLNDTEKDAFAHILREVRRKYDMLFQRTAAYMMMFFSAPTDGQDYSHHHFNVQFVSLERDGVNAKYRASVETGLLVWTNDLSPERAAAQLREATSNNHQGGWNATPMQR